MSKLYVRELKTGKVVHTVDCRDKSARTCEKVLMGLLMRTDTEHYYVDDSEIPDEDVKV